MFGYTVTNDYTIDTVLLKMQGFLSLAVGNKDKHNDGNHKYSLEGVSEHVCACLWYKMISLLHRLYSITWE